MSAPDPQDDSERVLISKDQLALLRREITNLRHRLRIAHALNVRHTNRCDCECDVCK